MQRQAIVLISIRYVDSLYVRVVPNIQQKMQTLSTPMFSSNFQKKIVLRNCILGSKSLQFWPLRDPSSPMSGIRSFFCSTFQKLSFSCVGTHETAFFLKSKSGIGGLIFQSIHVLHFAQIIPDVFEMLYIIIAKEFHHFIVLSRLPVMKCYLSLE